MSAILEPSTKAVVGVIYNTVSGHSYKILTIKNSRFGGTCLPGGKVEPGEADLDALVREVREETSLEVKRARFVYAAPGNVEPTRTVYVYLVEAFEGEPRTCETGNDVAWGIWANVMDCPVFGGFYRPMREATARVLDSIYRPPLS